MWIYPFNTYIHCLHVYKTLVIIQICLLLQSYSLELRTVLLLPVYKALDSLCHAKVLLVQTCLLQICGESISGLLQGCL
jgi:hypothetical protein